MFCISAGTLTRSAEKIKVGRKIIIISSEQTFYPLSFQQARFWFLSQLYPESSALNNHSIKRFKGILNVTHLKGVVYKLLKRHPSLSIKIKIIGDQPFQIHCDIKSIFFSFLDISTQDEMMRVGEVKRITQQIINTPINPLEDTLFRFILIKLDDQDYIIMILAHHIIFDLKSFDIYWRDLAEFYNSDEGVHTPLQEINNQYKDYVLWQHETYSDKYFKKEEHYWLNQFTDYSQEVNLPYDYEFKATQNLSGTRYSRNIKPELGAKIKSFCLKNKMVSFSTYLSAYFILLHICSQQNDIVIGTAFAGRNRDKRLSDLIGCFANTVAIRLHIPDDIEVLNFIKKVNDKVNDAYEMQYYPLEWLVNRINPKRETGSGPLINALFIKLSSPKEGLELEQLREETWPQGELMDYQVDLSLTILDGKNTLEIYFEYHTELFKEETIKRMMDHYINILYCIIKNPKLRLMELPKLPLPANGKMDRKNLPTHRKSGINLDKGYVAHRTPVEKSLVKIWSTVLGIERIGVHDNFFKIGGHSLLATQVISRIRRILSVDLPVRAMFDSQSIEELSLRIEEAQKGKRVNTPPIEPVARKKNIPVSSLQELHLFGIEINMYDPEQNRLPGPSFGYTFKEKLNINALSKTIQEIVRRHEILRTKYKIVDSEKYQVINEVPENILNIVDLENFSEGEIKDETTRLLLKRASDKLDIFNDSLMIMFTLILRSNEYDLIVTSHHIATDADSMSIIQKEIFILYQAFSNNMKSPLPELSIQYADFSIWERKQHSIENINDRLEYWKKELSNRLELKLPIDRNSPYKRTLNGDFVPIVIESELENQIKILSDENKVSMFTTLFAAYMSLVYCFSRYTYNESSIVFTQRTHEEVEPLVGCFADFQYIKIDFEGDPDFQELLRRTNETLLTARENYIPYSTFLKQTQIPAQIGFNFIQSQGNSLNRHNSATANNNIIPIRIPQPLLSLYWFALNLIEVSDKIRGVVIYQTEVYDHKTMLDLVENYIRLLTNIANNPKTRISELGIAPHNSAYNIFDINYYNQE